MRIIVHTTHHKTVHVVDRAEREGTRSGRMQIESVSAINSILNFCAACNYLRNKKRESERPKDGL